MASIRDWSRTAADNDDADSDINWAENQTAASVNNSARQMMARVAEWRDDIGMTQTTGGTANAQTLTARSSFTAYANGIVLAFKAVASNTGAATLNVNGIGAKAIRKFINGTESALAANDIVADGIYVVQYDAAANSAAGAWVLMNPHLGNAYEDGSFTPTFTCETAGDLSVSYGTRAGRYTRIGNQVFFHCRITFTPTHTTASGAVKFQGLPFTSANVSGLNYSCSLSEISNVDLASTDVQVTAFIPSATSEFRMTRVRDADAVSTMFISNFTSGTEFTVNASGAYQV